MSDGGVFRDYVCNVCLPGVAMFHSQLASRKVPFCESLVDFYNRRDRFHNRGRGSFRGERGRFKKSNQRN